MTRRGEGGRGPSREWESELHGVQRLASKLQKAISTGHATYMDMHEVDEYLVKRYSSQIEGILGVAHGLAEKATKPLMQKKFGLLQAELERMLGNLRSRGIPLYAEMISEDGKISPSRLRALIDTDSALTSALSALQGATVELSKVRPFSQGDFEDLWDIVGELRRIAKKRLRLFE